MEAQFTLLEVSERLEILVVAFDRHSTASTLTQIRHSKELKELRKENNDIKVCNIGLQNQIHSLQERIENLEMR